MVIYGLHRNKNLQDILVTAKVDHHPERLLTTDRERLLLWQMIYICKRESCRYYPKIDTSSYVVSSHHGRQFQTIKNITCE